MKNAIDRVYGRQKLFSWRRLAGRMEATTWAATYFIILAALFIAWLCT